MKENKINEFDLIDTIGQTKDIDALYKLENNAAFSIALYQILDSLYDHNPEQLNRHQLNLFLCMHLENSGQSCGILGCLQEWFPQHLDKFVPALRDINAQQCADAIEKAIKLLPEDGSWFFKSADEQSKQELEEYDRIFSNYPDGNMPNIYRKYAERYKDEVICW